MCEKRERASGVAIFIEKSRHYVTETRLPLSFIAANDAIIFGFHGNEIQRFRQTNDALPRLII
jgi:hypothetical protein